MIVRNGKLFVINSYLNHYTDNTLNTHDENAFGALFGRVPVPITDSVLSFDAEKKGRRETVNVSNARFPTGRSLVI